MKIGHVMVAVGMILLAPARLGAEDGIDRLVSRYADATAATQDISGAAKHRATIRPDGSWADIDYADQRRSRWTTGIQHLGHRLCALAADWRRNRDGASLADYFPEEGSAQLGLFAVRVDCPDDGSFVGHALRVTLAEAASEHLGRQWEALLPEGIKLIRPGIGYACCPDHSLKRDILAALPGTGISLTDSCAMIPEASICGLVIAHKDAAYNNIRKVDASKLEAYAVRRGFKDEEKKLFLSHLM